MREEVVARLEGRQQRRRVLLPQIALLRDPVAAVDDHLLRDLHKESRHAVGRRVVPRDCVHHPQVVEQAAERLGHPGRVGRVQRLDVLVERVQVPG